MRHSLILLVKRSTKRLAFIRLLGLRCSVIGGVFPSKIYFGRVLIIARVTTFNYGLFFTQRNPLIP
jgi:hypothetical protein